MKGLASVIGEANSTVWLGPEANERQFEGDELPGLPHHRARDPRISAR